MPRRSVHVDGLSHGRTPIPTASVVGNVLVTSGVSGKDADGRVVPDLQGQVAAVFANIGRVLRAGGASPDDVVSCTFWVRDREAVRPLIDRQWIEMFPDPDSRPARHTLVYDLPKGQHCQCQLMAVIGS